MKKHTKITICILSSLFLILCAFYIWIFIQTRPVISSKKADTSEGEKARIEIPSGTSVLQVSRLLEEKKIIRKARLFYLSVRFPVINRFFLTGKDFPKNFVLKSGIYRLSGSMNYAEIQTELTSGQQEFIKLSIPEGLTITKIAVILEENKICPKDDFISICKKPELFLPLLKDYVFSNNAASLEGYLFPDTYYFTPSMDTEEVVKMMVKNFFEKTETLPSLSGKTPQQLYEILTLASIVEREYRVPEEAPLIASVFKNRISKNIGLYSCATIEYIITEIEGKPHPERILLDDLKIDSPYNTYKWAGLTPGPISNPGLIAIKAACDTPETNYYFFQIADQSAGRHVFSTTFEEHKVNHNLYTKN